MTATVTRERVGGRYSGLVQEAAADFRVHTRLYTDPALFEAELERLFHQGWVYVGHTSEVAQPGSFKTTRLGRRPILLSRDETGALHVLLNVCRHRGAAVCREAEGQATSFQCPYHGWVYGLDGRLRGISERSGYPDAFGADLDGLLRVPRVAEYRGLIFASLSPTGESLASWLGGAKEYIDLWADLSPTGQVAVRPAHRYAYQGNWKFQVENTVDGYHPRFVHESAFKTREHFGGRPARESASALDNGYTIGWDAQGHSVLGSPVPTTGPRVGLTQLPPPLFREYMDSLERAHGAERTAAIIHNRHVVIVPNVVLMDVNIRVIQPLSVDRTEVYSHYVALDGVSDEVNRLRLRDVQGRLGTTGMINSDDLEMFAACQTGLQTPELEWVRFARGLGREEIGPSGERTALYTDETPQRALYRAWVRLMEGTDE
jgi:phenylpropionate dioxygenase-like ring-hydroxylating dioxygenase large terminal subunit